MRYLGIDYGTQKIGYALSDEAGRVAFPGGVIKNDKNCFNYFFNLIKEKQINKIVLGQSLNQAGAPNPIHFQAQNFAKELELKTGLEIAWCDERFTSNEANRGIDRDKEVDARAATLILARYLEHLHPVT